MIRNTVQLGDSRLKAQNRAVTDFNDPEVKKVVDDLIDSMRADELIGMAAPQIGENWQIFVTEPRETKIRTGDQTDELRVYINPKIVELSEEEAVIWEGCGSCARKGIQGPVSRPKEITIEARDLTGRRFRLICDGILARVIQHEVDHLKGIEFIEKVTDIRQLKSPEFYIRDVKGLPEVIAAGVITKKVFQFI
jgi:peptide deformylase